MASVNNVSKKRKRRHKWKPVSIDGSCFVADDMDGFVSLEVLDDYEINDESGGKVIKQSKGSLETVKKTKPKKKKQKKASKEEKESKKEEKEVETVCNSQLENIDLQETDDDNENDWKYLGVHPLIGKQLINLGFKEPTAIQREVIPSAIEKRMDIIGAAETGSGKTLAYGIPLLHRLLESKLKQANEDNSQENVVKDSSLDVDNWELGACNDGILSSPKTGVCAMVVAPTRELALQVHKSLEDVAKVLSIKVASVVGGMSEEKQQRILKDCPEVVVATPGRLWHLIDQGDAHLSQLSNLQSFVVDEADRMVQDGHYQELSYLLDRINNNSKRMLSKLQKSVFSATLTYSSSSKKNPKNNLDKLLKKVGMKEKSKVADLTPKGITVETLTESKLMCSVEDKDMYLYYFLTQYPNRTLVFVNTIDTLRRLSAILTLLKLSPLPLHAGMQQRQRLKNLDRFKSRENGLLLASDVAARGLDIKGVQHVIHYQIPKNAEVYVHRSGRTARIYNEGLSLLLVSPEDLRAYEKIWKSLKKGNEPPDFPVDVDYLKGIKTRLSLARSIDKEEHRFRRKKSSNDWFLTNAKEAELQLDEDLLEDLGDFHEQRVIKQRLASKKEELNTLLNSPLTLSGFCGKYPTKQGKLTTTALQLIEETGQAIKREALKDVKSRKKQRKKNR